MVAERQNGEADAMGDGNESLTLWLHTKYSEDHSNFCSCSTPSPPWTSSLILILLNIHSSSHKFGSQKPSQTYNYRLGQSCSIEQGIWKQNYSLKLKQPIFCSSLLSFQKKKKSVKSNTDTIVNGNKFIRKMVSKANLFSFQTELCPFKEIPKHFFCTKLISIP